MQIGSAVTPKPGSQEGTFKTVHSTAKMIDRTRSAAKATCASSLQVPGRAQCKRWWRRSATRWDCEDTAVGHREGGGDVGI